MEWKGLRGMEGLIDSELKQEQNENQVCKVENSVISLFLSLSFFLYHMHNRSPVSLFIHMCTLILFGLSIMMFLMLKSMCTEGFLLYDQL